MSPFIVFPAIVVDGLRERIANYLAAGTRYLRRQSAGRIAGPPGGACG